MDARAIVVPVVVAPAAPLIELAKAVLDEIHPNDVHPVFACVVGAAVFAVLFPAVPVATVIAATGAFVRSRVPDTITRYPAVTSEAVPEIVTFE